MTRGGSQPAVKDATLPGIEQQALQIAAEASEPEAFDKLSRGEELRYKTSTRRFRGLYAGTLLFLLALQLAATNGIFLAVGRGLLEYDPITLRIFVGATVTQVVALVLVIVRHLFPNNR